MVFSSVIFLYYFIPAFFLFYYLVAEEPCLSGLQFGLLRLG